MDTSKSFPQLYVKSFQVYLSRSTQQQATLNWIKENLADVLKRAGTKPSTPNTPFKVLGVGCGVGSSGDLLILEVVAKHLSTASPSKSVIYNKAVEPRSNALSIFQSSAEAWKQEKKELEVSFDWFNGTWQEYQAESEKTEKFHLIHFGQSMYYLNAEETLQDCIKNRLKKNGFVVCFIASEDGPEMRYYKAFRLSCLSGEILVDIAAKNGWNHELYQIDVSIDLTEIFDQSSVEGNLLLDFLTQTTNFRDVSDKAKVAEVIQFWMDSSLARNDDRRVMYGKIEAVVIFRN